MGTTPAPNSSIPQSHEAYAIDFNFICEQVQQNMVMITHIQSRDQIADILIKQLPKYGFH